MAAQRRTGRTIRLKIGGLRSPSTAIRENRRRRKQSFVLILFGVLVLLVLMLPSLASFAGVGRTMLAKHLADAGWTAEASDVRMGWITPISARDLVLVGPSGETRIEIDRLRGEHTILGALSGRRSTDCGVIEIDGIRVETSVVTGTTSIESDLMTLTGESSESTDPTALVHVQSLDVMLVDATSGRRWKFGGGNGTVDLQNGNTVIDVEGVLTDPRGHGGQIIGAIQIQGDRIVQAEAKLQSLPLSILSPISRRLETFGDDLANFSGDASGLIRFADGPDGIAVVTENVRIEGWQSDIPRIADDGQIETLRLSNRDASIDGLWELLPQRLIARDCKISADFISVTGSASLPWNVSAADLTDPVGWLQRFDGDIRGTVDLVAMDHAMPGYLPLRRDAKLTKAAANFELETDARAEAAHLRLRTTAIAGRSDLGEVSLDPMNLTADVTTLNRQLVAQQIEFNSSFGKVSGNGQLAAGSLNFDLRLDELSNAVGSLVDAGRLSPSGIAQGQVRWANLRGQWRLDGDASASHFGLFSSTNGSGNTADDWIDFDSHFSAEGRWNAESATLQWLDAASIELAMKDAKLNATLLQPTKDPLTAGDLPVQFSGNGSLTSIYAMLPSTMRSRDIGLGGTAEFAGNAIVSMAGGAVGPFKMQCSDVWLENKSALYRQSSLELDVDGQFQWPSAKYNIANAVFVAPALTAVASGRGDLTQSDFDINVRTELSRLSQIAASPSPPGTLVGSRAHNTPYPLRTASFQNHGHTGPPSETTTYEGSVTGDLALTIRDGQWNLRNDLVMDQFIISSIDGSNSSSTFTASREPRTVWFEPRVEIRGDVGGRLLPDEPKGGTMQPDDVRTIQIDDVAVRGHWFQTSLTGDCLIGTEGVDLQCSGPTVIDMDVVAQRLSSILQTPVAAEGLTQSDVKIRFASSQDSKFDIAGDVSWELAEIAGVTMGPTTLPIHLTEREVRIDHATVPVSGGQVHVAGVARYQPGPIRIDLAPGRLADHVELTPEMTGTWMKYLAPVVAGAANVSGTVSAELNGGTIYVESPTQSQVSGRLSIEQASMTAGQMVDRLLVGVDQAKTLAGTLLGNETRPTGRTLVTMPPQVVEFAMQDGHVHHDRMYFNIDRAEVVTSGSVAVDGRVNLVAQIPIHSSWVGSDLRSLAGRPLTLPVTGTLSRINVDTSAVGQLIGQSVINAGQNEVNKYLDNQIGRGLDKLLGR